MILKKRSAGYLLDLDRVQLAEDELSKIGEPVDYFDGNKSTPSKFHVPPRTHVRLEERGGPPEHLFEIVSTYGRRIRAPKSVRKFLDQFEAQLICGDCGMSRKIIRHVSILRNPEVILNTIPRSFGGLGRAGKIE